MRVCIAMESKMITVFLISLWATFILIRIYTQFVDYPVKDKSKLKTPTKILSRKIGFEIHHFHFGILILVLTLITILFLSLNTLFVIFLAIGASLYLDQAYLPIFKNVNYFSIKGYTLSLLPHLILTILLISLV